MERLLATTHYTGETLTVACKTTDLSLAKQQRSTALAKCRNKLIVRIKTTGCPNSRTVE
jgi:hypothetical protein